MRNLNFNKKTIETIVAFSNSTGGRIVFGVNDNQKIVGVNLSSESIQKWVNQVKQNTTPQIVPNVELIEILSKKVIVFEIIKYPVKPVSYRNKFFKRVANSNHLMCLDEIANEHLKTINSSWDFYPDPNHNLKNISIEKIKRFISIIEEKKQSKISQKPIDFLSRLEFIRDGKLTFGAYLLFVKDNCLISDIQVGRFKSEFTIIDSLSLDTDLFTEIDEVITFIKKHLMVEFIITGEPKHKERFDYPIEAIREIVVNMIIHRDYRDSSGSIIKIYDDKIEFFNPGRLYGNITIKDLLSDNYTSQTRNKLIAKAFKEIGIIEKYGSGIRRILDLCEQYGVIAPKFEETFNGFKVTLFKEKLNVPVNVPINVPVNARQKSIIPILGKNRNITIKDLAAKVIVSEKTIKRDLEKLKKLKIIKRIGSDKTGNWELIL